MRWLGSNPKAYFIFFCYCRVQNYSTFQPDQHSLLFCSSYTDLLSVVTHTP